MVQGCVPLISLFISGNEYNMVWLYGFQANGRGLFPSFRIALHAHTEPSR